LRKHASLRIIYAFDVVDEKSGSKIRGEERSVTIPIGAAGTSHAFAMQSLWIEAQPTGIEDALKAAYSRLRDAEATASAAKSRAIALRDEVIRARHHAGSTARANELSLRERALEKRQADLNDEVIRIENTVARALADAESTKREAAKAVSDAAQRLAVAEDEIARLRARDAAVRSANARSRAWRATDAPDTAKNTNTTATSAGTIIDVPLHQSERSRAHPPRSTDAALSIYSAVDSQQRSAARILALAEERLARLTRGDILNPTTCTPTSTS
jgi:hypothetical protein